jgi:Methyltransferase domain
MISEPSYWIAKATSLIKGRVGVTDYVPQRRIPPARMPNVDSAWKGIESVLEDLLDHFQIPRQSCLEFGVEHGYSTAAFASFFEHVTGVDTFTGDIHTRDHGDVYDQTRERLATFPNITLVRSDYRDWIVQDRSAYDLIHVDIVHTYSDTYACGLWAAHHGKCALFHDTESFRAVKQAVSDIARITGKRFYNFRECFGLGILV